MQQAAVITDNPETVGAGQPKNWKALVRGKLPASEGPPQRDVIVNILLHVGLLRSLYLTLRYGGRIVVARGAH